jgi:hypothetical protein
MASREPREFRMHAGAKLAFGVSAGLCLLLIVIGWPVGLWFLITLLRGRLIIDRDGVRAASFFNTRIDFTEVERLGLVRMPIIGGGIGGYLARRKCDGPEGISLFARYRSGKERNVLVSLYESPDEILREVQERVGKPIETMEMGLLSPKWPQQ